MNHAGQVRALAVTSPRTICVYGKVPTREELGQRKARFEDWYGFFAPAREQHYRLDNLRDDIVRTLKLPELTTMVVVGGSEVVASTPEAFAAQLRQDMERWSRVVKLSGAKID
jgi:tripartite-type tricarboxylate transporter receptor subunit TctC